MMENANVAETASVLLVAVFYLTMFGLTTIGIYYGIKKAFYKRKEKFSIKLIESGYIVITSYRGVPHLLIKNNQVVNAWHGKKL